jgi:hypothetical protein
LWCVGIGLEFPGGRRGSTHMIRILNVLDILNIFKKYFNIVSFPQLIPILQLPYT